MLASHHRADRYVPHLSAGLRSAVWIIFEGKWPNGVSMVDLLCVGSDAVRANSVPAQGSKATL